MNWLKTKRAAALLLVICTLFSSGCINFISNLLHRPNMVAAKFPHLEGKRVAVVCPSLSGSLEPGDITAQLGKSVAAHLRVNVKEIKMIEGDKIADWLDRKDRDLIDYVGLGKDLKADFVVAIELNRPITLRDGPTLFQGKADVTTSVYAVNQRSTPVFRQREEDFLWPAHGRYGVTERQFERAFVNRLSLVISRYFHKYEMYSDLGEGLDRL